MIQKGKKPSSDLTLVAQVMAEIEVRIESQRLGQGAKLPSIRRMAQLVNVSKSTVVNAYDRLVAQGIIEPKKGSGFYVAKKSPPLNLSHVGPKIKREIDPLWVSRQSLEAGENALKPGCGWLPSSWMPHDSIRRALRVLSRAQDDALSEYGSPHGNLALREYLLGRMADIQVLGNLDNIMLSGSGTQNLDLLCRFFVEPGDVVMVDDPCYFNFHALLKAHRVKVISVAYGKNGPDIELFEQALLTHKPRLYITNSAIHNPTGAVLSPVVAHQVLKLAEQSDLIIIEDDIFADLENVLAPRLAALDGLNRVVHMGSFSKTLSASLRLGYIGARADWIEGLVDLKIATTFGGDPFAAEFTLLVLRDRAYGKHLAGLKARLSDAMEQTCARLEGIGVEPWLKPQAGMYVWAKLPNNLEGVEVARLALEQDIILAPGNVFSLSENASGYLRFNVSQSLSAEMFEKLGAIICS